MTEIEKYKKVMKNLENVGYDRIKVMRSFSSHLSEDLLSIFNRFLDDISFKYFNLLPENLQKDFIIKYFYTNSDFQEKYKNMDEKIMQPIITNSISLECFIDFLDENKQDTSQIKTEIYTRIFSFFSCLTEEAKKKFFNFFITININMINKPSDLYAYVNDPRLAHFLIKYHKNYFEKIGPEQKDLTDMEIQSCCYLCYRENCSCDIKDYIDKNNIVAIIVKNEKTTIYKSKKEFSFKTVSEILLTVRRQKIYLIVYSRNTMYMPVIDINYFPYTDTCIFNIMQI